VCGRTERALMTHTQAQHAALHAARQRQTTQAFRDQYVSRAEIEGTLSQGTRRCMLRRSRSIGLAKTRLQHLLIGAVLNGIRVAAWLVDVPHAQTYRSAFATLAGVPTLERCAEYRFASGILTVGFYTILHQAFVHTALAYCMIKGAPRERNRTCNSNRLISKLW
jgi:hypothetical protein